MNSNNVCPCDLPDDLVGFCKVRRRLLSIKEIKRCREDEEYRKVLNDKYRDRYVRESGPGSELAKILHMFGIKPTSSCHCEHYAQYMNEKGVDWCLENIDVIVDWLKAESKKRKLPFSRTIAKMVIKHAITTYQQKTW